MDLSQGLTAGLIETVTLSGRGSRLLVKCDTLSGLSQPDTDILQVQSSPDHGLDHLHEEALFENRQHKLYDAEVNQNCKVK